MASAKKTSAKKSVEAPAKVVDNALAGKAPAPGVLRYALTFARTTMGEGGDEVTVTEDAGLVKFACRGVPYATFRVEGGDLVVTLRQPKVAGDMAAKLALYRKAPEEGWLEWRTPVSRDPRPWLEADIGTVLGTTLYEILQGGRAS